MLVRRKQRVFSLDACDFTDSQAKQFADVAQTQSWQVAAHDYMRPANHRAYRLGIDEYRSQIRFLLPLTRESRVLNLQSDWGSVAFNLATHVAFVVAMDNRATRSRFVSSRHRQMGVQTLHPICGNVSPCLPFIDETFDAVVMPEATEGLKITAGVNWKAAETVALREVKRVLKKGGCVLLGVANRLSIARSDAGSSRYLRTYWGYRRALRKAGFSRIEFYASLPSHQEPFFLFPVARREPFNYFVTEMFSAQDYRTKLEARGLGFVYRLALRLQIVGQRLHAISLGRYFIPGYIILAEK